MKAFGLFAVVLCTFGGQMGNGQDLLFDSGLAVGDAQLPPNDDSYSSAIALSVPFRFFGNEYSQVYVCTNGILSFNSGISSYTPTPFPIASNPVIAPFWADVDISSRGNVYYREESDAAFLSELSLVISSHFGPRRQAPPNFAATSAFVATWDNVPAYGSASTSSTNTFQAVAVTDGTYSYVIYNYQEVTWTFGSASSGIPGQVGFDAGDQTNYFAVPSSRTADIANIDDQTNVIAPVGRWMFRVDLAEIVDGGSDPVCGVPEDNGGCDNHQRPTGVDDECEDIAPQVSACPELEGPTRTDEFSNSFEFTCEFAVNVEGGTTNYGIEVNWLFDGEPLITDTLGSSDIPGDGAITARLPHTDLVGADHMGKWVSCEVKTFFTNTADVYSSPLSTGSYWLGVKTMQFNDEGELEDVFFLTVDEADADPARLFLVPTFPIVVNTVPEAETDHRFLIYSPNQLMTYQHDLGFNCSYNLRGEDWMVDDSHTHNGEHPLVIRTVPSPYSEPPMIDFIEFEADSGVAYSYLEDYAPPSITVYRYNDAGRAPATCIASGDPRMTSFDNRYFDMDQTGARVMAISDAVDYSSGSYTWFEVEMITKPCNRAGGSIVSCACGVAMRYGSEAFYVNNCNARGVPSTGMRYPGWNAEPPTPHETLFTYEIEDSGHWGSVTAPDGSNLRFYVYPWGMNVYLTAAGRHFDRLSGLCGNFNGDRSDDLMHSDGSLADEDDGQDMADFSFQFRRTQDESMFNANYTPPAEPTLSEEPEVEDVNQYCTCNHPNAEDEGNNNRCEVPPASTTPPLTGGSFATINIVGTSQGIGGQGTFSPFVPGGGGGFGAPTGFGKRRRRRSVDDEIDFGEDYPTYNQNTFPTPSNITEAEAIAYCTDALTGGCGDSSLDQSVVDGIINNCVEDVRDLDSLDSVSESFIGDTQFTCVMQIVQTVNLTGENSTMEEIVAAVDALLGPIVTSMCTADCSGHGVCTNATCFCNEGWIGTICDIDESSLPHVSGFTFGDVCDSQAETCTSVQVIADNVFGSDNLNCKVEYDGQEYTQVAIIRSFLEVECDLPDILIAESNLLDFEISVTTDGTHYGDSLPYRIYSSECITCVDALEDCTTDAGWCSISEVCYAETAQNPEAFCFVCNTTNSQAQFYETPNCDSGVDGVGEWQDWSDWSECELECDYAWERRARDCFVADTCLVGDDEERQLCRVSRCLEVEDETENSVLLVIDGASDDDIGNLLDQDENMRDVIATKLNNYCIDNPDDCCEFIGVDAVSPSMSIFTADDVRVAAGSMETDSDDDTTQMRLVAEITTATLSAACSGSGSRRRRSADTVYVPSDVMEEVAEDSINAFAAFSVDVVSVGEYLSSEEYYSGSDSNESREGGFAAATVAIAVGCILAAVVAIVIIAIVVHNKNKKATPVQPMAAGQGQSNPALVTQDEMAMHYKHKMINVAPPPAYEDDVDGLAGGIRQAPPTYNTMGQKFFG